MAVVVVVAAAEVAAAEVVVVAAVVVAAVELHLLPSQGLLGLLKGLEVPQEMSCYFLSPWPIRKLQWPALHLLSLPPLSPSPPSLLQQLGQP